MKEAGVDDPFYAGLLSRFNDVLVLRFTLPYLVTRNQQKMIYASQAFCQRFGPGVIKLLCGNAPTFCLLR
ncbi:hypothetical protein D9M70_540300 [compost metagenome]